MSRHLMFLVALFAFAVGSVAVVHAQGDRPPRRPPPEAFEACADQEEGSLCAVETPHGTLEGTCRAPRGETLACVPNDHRPPPREGRQ
ncbi:MAG: hypothetical protein RLP09_48185 [Sandaracinaceae bacterium]